MMTIWAKPLFEELDCKMAPRGKSETCVLASPSLVLELITDFWFLALRQPEARLANTKHTHTLVCVQSEFMSILWNFVL